MKRWVNKFIRYGHLYLRLVKLSLMEVFVYRPNALAVGMAPIIWTLVAIFSLKIIYSRVSAIAGWNFYEMVFLLGVNELFFLLTWLTFARNLREMVFNIPDGYLDQFLTKPVNPRFLASFWRVDLTALGSLVNTVLILGWVGKKLDLQLSLAQVLNGVVLLTLCYILIYCLYFILASLSLWLLRAEVLLDWLFEAMEFGRYPEDIYRGWTRKVLLFVVPVLFFAYVPVAQLLGKISLRYTGIAFLLVIIFSLISKILWRLGLKRYQSASS